MNANIAALLYLVAGVLFIQALRGLSSPDTSRRGNYLGMIGMTIAVLTTLAAHPPVGNVAWGLVVGGIALGGGIGAVIARRVPMTSMPELVAAFHSLVGMAAVLVAAGAYLRAGGLRHRHARPHPRRQPDRNVARGGDRRHHLHRLGDRVPEALRPHERQADHAARPPCHQHRAVCRADLLHLQLLRRAEPARLLADRGDLADLRRADHRADRRRRHAGGDLDAQFLFGLGGGRHRLHAGQLSA